MFTSACVFLDGHHRMAGPNCPHGPGKNEVGDNVQPGWTVQQANQEGHDSGDYQAEQG